MYHFSRRSLWCSSCGQSSAAANPQMLCLRPQQQTRHLPTKAWTPTGTALRTANPRRTTATGGRAAAGDSPPGPPDGLQFGGHGRWVGTSWWYTPTSGAGQQPNGDQPPPPSGQLGRKSITKMIHRWAARSIFGTLPHNGTQPPHIMRRFFIPGTRDTSNVWKPKPK